MRWNRMKKKPQYLPFEHGPDGLAGDLASPRSWQNWSAL